MISMNLDLPKDELADYLADHYGRCHLLKNCRCLREGWRGRMCSHWQPTTARNWLELKRLLEGK